MMFAHIRQENSLRDIDIAINAHADKLYHMGIQQCPRTTLADANERRDYRIYEEFAKSLMQHAGRVIGWQEAKRYRVECVWVVNNDGWLAMADCGATIKVYRPDGAYRIEPRIQERKCRNFGAIPVEHERTMLVATIDHLQRIPVDPYLIRANRENGLSGKRKLTDTEEPRERPASQSAAVHSNDVCVFGSDQAGTEVALSRSVRASD